MKKEIEYNKSEYMISKSYGANKKYYPYDIEDKKCRSTIARICVNSGFEKGNSEFIVRACNNHEELVLIVKELNEAIKRGGDLQLGPKGRNATLAHRVTNVLEKV